jgi:hypothetical protein
MRWNNISSTSGEFLLTPRFIFSILLPLCCGFLYPVAADSLTGSNGLTLTGEIVSMVEGELTFKTQVGIHKLPMKEVKSFTIDRGAPAKSIQSASNQPSSIDAKQLLDRLDSLASTLANLERQILRVQTTQESQIRQVDQRTYDLNPEKNLKVVNSRLTKRSSATIVTGQVINESASEIGNVQAEVVLYGRTGRLRLSGGEKRQTVPVNPVILGPGQTGTFTAQFEGGLVVSNFDVFPRALNPGGYNSNLQVQPKANQF